MNLAKNATLLLLATLSSASFAATDWTSYLQPMQDSCRFQELEIPKLKGVYKKSVANTNIQNKGKGESIKRTITYTLKNATAFGYPLTKVIYTGGYENEAVSLYFGTAEFMKLRSSFKPAQDDMNDPNLKITSKGYQLSNSDLSFDSKAKAITCSAYS